MGRLFIAPYKMGSESGRVLAQALGCKRVDGTKIFRRSDVILNWGNSSLAPRGGPSIINIPEGVSYSANKINSFRAFNHFGVATVAWTTSRDQAKAWLDEGHTVYGRSLVSAHSGQGIKIMSPENGLWHECALYTKGMHKSHEYRVHVFGGRVIDMQKKRRRNNVEASDFIKNLDNGWVFCRDNALAPKAVYDESVKAVAALDLDFGAVDVIYRERDNTVAVLEVNSSPGLEGTTLQRYKEAICDRLHLRSI